MLPFAIPVTPARLKDVVAQLATRLDRGTLRATVAELDTVAYLCERASLPAEAARVRRWYGHETPIAIALDLGDLGDLGSDGRATEVT